MPNYDSTVARCFVYAYKDGLLAAVGHDVKLKVGTFAVAVDGERVTATFEANSLAVVCAMRAGADNPGALSDKDRATIESYVRDDILHVRRHPRIEFRSTARTREGDQWRIDGELTLHGQTRALSARLSRRGDELVTGVRIAQPDFGIAPFKAMLGALRIQPAVEVELVVPSVALG